MRMSMMLTADKRLLRRNAILVLPDRASQAQERVSSSLRLARDSIGEQVNSSIRYLAENTLASVPSLKLNVQTTYSDDPHLTDLFGSSLVEREREIRAFAYLFKVDDGDSEGIDDPGLSHLVTIQATGAKQGWYASSGLSSAIVETSPANVPNLIHDVMLDIAMFHSYPFLATYREDLDFRKRFSEEKVKYALAERLTSFYGPIREETVQYFTFAAHCRINGKFDYDEYERVWSDFVMRWFIDKRVPALEELSRESAVVDWITNIHKLAGQLSRRRLMKSIVDLEPDAYALVVAVKRPNRMRDRTFVSSLLGRQRWKGNSWRIVRFTEVNRFARAFPFVTILKFRIL